MRNYLLNHPNAQDFINDLSLYSHGVNNPNQQITDPESINEDSILNSMLNQQPTPDENRLGQTDPTDIHSNTKYGG